MAHADLYSELGLSKGASKDEIKKAYRRLARELHPDRNPDNAAAEDRFKRVAYAHDVLTDDEKRRLYDEFGELGLKEGFDPERARAYSSRAPGGMGGMGGGFGGFEDLLRGVRRGRGGGFASTVEDLFGANVEDLFRGAGRARPRARKGRDQHSEIRIGFEEAIKGTEKELRIDDQGEQRVIRVRIPAGAEDGDRVRLRGQGDRVAGGEPGDLVLTVRVEDHPLYRRDGRDLHLDLPVTLLEAWKGTTVSVPTPTGSVSLKIPARVQSGAKLRLRGKGVPGRKGQPGDLFVHVQVRLPEGGDEEKVGAVLGELEREYGPGLRAHLRE